MSTVPATTVIWRRVDQPGHESARLREGPETIVLEGAAVFRESRRPCRLDYHIVCDAAWRTVSARVTGWCGDAEIDLKVGVDAGRVWSLNGQPSADVRGCDDIDLSFSPATNLLPIRRTQLAIGERVAVRAAWLVFPDFTLKPLDQTYERVAEALYRYQSGTFVAMLETNSSGFITRYSGLWEVEQLG